MKFGDRIGAYEEEILQALEHLVAIPSVCGEPQPGMPYGTACAEALEYVLGLAQEMGFSVRNVGNYAGHAEYDCGTQGMAAVLAHVDVVPAGQGWETDPFTLVRKGNLLFGRGVLDDKGAAVTALYCMKALKDANVQGRRKLRVIFGAGEEIGMEDMKHYFQIEPFPDLAFTPDSDYGICNREKGILHAEFSGSPDAKVVRSFRAGNAVNAVPDQAEVTLACSDEEISALLRHSENVDGQFVFDRLNKDCVMIRSKGTAAHAMCPHEGHNAATALLELLAAVFSPAQLGTLLSFLQQKIGWEVDGTRLGIAREDVLSGPLTVNLGVVQADQDKQFARIDIRFPVTADSTEIEQNLQKAAQAFGLDFTVTTKNLPLYFPEEDPLIRTLQNAYESVTGEKPDLYATGGGTYARAVPGHCVAFGPVFPGEPDRRMHNCQEHIDWNYFRIHAQICLEAMYRMITE